MRNFEALKEHFRDNINASNYFESAASELVCNKLKESIADPKIPYIFIIGDSGVGKSFILQLMEQATALYAPTFLIQDPFFKSKYLLDKLAEKKDIFFLGGRTIDESIEYLLEAYSDKICTIFIDESGLLGDNAISLLEKLTQTKRFQVVFSLYPNKANALLSKEQFNAGNIVKIECRNLNVNEIYRYTKEQFEAFGEDKVVSSFSKSMAKQIFTYTKGNFRLVKKILFSLVRLLEYAQNNGLSSYYKINRALITMAHYDSDERHFEELHSRYKRVQRRKFLRIFAVLVLLVAISFGAYSFLKVENTPTITTLLPQMNENVVVVVESKNDEERLLKRLESKKSFEDAYALSLYYFEEQMYDKAIIWAQEAIKLDQKSDRPWIIYAKAQFHQGKREEAVSSLEQSLSYIASEEIQELLIFYKGQK